jgi:ribosomal protein S18 acetylase RimI-like enzyme
MDFRICKVAALDTPGVSRAAAVCVDGMYDTLLHISKDQVVLKELMKASMDYDMNYVCLHDEKVVGFMGISDCSRRAANKMRQETFEQLFEESKAISVYKAVMPTFVAPRIADENEVEIEFLSVAANFRGQGAGTYMINFLRKNFRYHTCVLDVSSKNPKAIKFLKKMGFEQEKAKTDWRMLLRGAGKTITMKLDMRGS